jgi:hypothetical protein
MENKKENVTILIPSMSSDEELESDARMERILENAQNAMMRAKKEQEENEVKENILKENLNDISIEDMSIEDMSIEDMSIDDMSIDDILDTKFGKSQNNDESINKEKKVDKNGNTLRQLTGIEKIIIGILMLLPGLQLLFMAVTPVVVYLAYSFIALVFIIILSNACYKQYSMVVVHAILMIASMLILINGFECGMKQEDLLKRSVFKISNINNNMPTESKCDKEDINEEKILNEFNGKFIYLYKYGCSDCAAIDDQMNALFETNGYERISIESRSELGKTMVELFSVKEVPTGIIIHNDGTYTKHNLHKIENNKVTLDNEKLGDLLHVLSKEIANTN